MSHEEENVVIDQPKPKRIKRFFYKALLLMIVLCAMGYAGYYGWMRLFSKVDQKIQPIQANLSAVRSAAENQRKTLQTLTDDYQQLKQSINQSQSEHQSLISEVRFLVKLANINLQFQHNTAQAIEILKLAEQDIHDIADAKFDEVRKALIADIAALQAAPEVDVSAIYTRLMALNAKVDQLPLMNKETTPTDKNSAGTAENLSWWQKGWQQTLESLRNVVVVRHYAPGKIPFVTPEQQGYLYQNWHAMFLHAMSALMQSQSDIYRASLQQIEIWIKEYGMAGSPNTTAFLSELRELQAIDIHPATPTLSHSLQAVDALTVS